HTVPLPWIRRSCGQVLTRFLRSQGNLRAHPGGLRDVGSAISEPEIALPSSTPSQTWARTRRGERINSGRPACQAASAITQTAAKVNATRVSTADQPKTGGRGKRKKNRTRPHKRPRRRGVTTAAAGPG